MSVRFEAEFDWRVKGVVESTDEEVRRGEEEEAPRSAGVTETAWGKDPSRGEVPLTGAELSE